WRRAALLAPRPVTQPMAICAACEPTAMRIDAIWPVRYGRMKPSRRMNVRRYGTALTTVRLSSVGGAPDGSPVTVSLRLPSRGEGELVAAALPPPASLLELGCGTGRVTQQLVARGYSVVAVDESQEMLAHVRGAETV